MASSCGGARAQRCCGNVRVRIDTSRNSSPLSESQTPSGPFTVGRIDSERITVQRAWEVFSERSPRVSVDGSSIDPRRGRGGASRRRWKWASQRLSGGFCVRGGTAWAGRRSWRGNRWSGVILAGSSRRLAPNARPRLPSGRARALGENRGFELSLSCFTHPFFLTSVIPSPGFTSFPRAAAVWCNRPFLSLRTHSPPVPAFGALLPLTPPVLSSQQSPANMRTRARTLRGTRRRTPSRRRFRARLPKKTGSLRPSQRRNRRRTTS